MTFYKILVNNLKCYTLFIQKDWVAICVCVYYGLVNTNTDLCWLKHVTRLRYFPDLRTNISEFHGHLCSCKIPTYSNVNYSNSLNKLF